MFGNEFYHETIRRYVIVFGTMFNDMVVWRRNTAGAIIKRIKVPIAYGPRAKFLSRIQQDPNLTKPDAISLPRMSFQIAGYNYDVTRKLTTVGQIKGPGTSDTVNGSVYNPVPWNIDFDLSIYVLNAEDGTQLIEQILPYFTPEWTNTMKLVDDLDIRMDVPVVLNTITTEDTYEDSYENRRTIIHTLNFTMKGYLFGPVKNKDIINVANTRTFVLDGFESDIETANSGPNAVTGLTISNAGSGYVNNQLVTFSNGTSNSTARITTNATGSITSLTILTGGQFANTSTIRTQIANSTAPSNATNGNTSSGTGAAFVVALGSGLFFTTTSVRPGLLANGSPTSNAALSVPVANIASNDNWDFIVTVNTNPDFPVDDPTNDPDT
jgi:hypothetical protein